MRSLYVPQSHGYVFLYSITSQDSLNCLEDKIEHIIRLRHREMPFLIVEYVKIEMNAKKCVRNKIDCEAEMELGIGRKVAEKYNARFAQVW